MMRVLQGDVMEQLRTLGDGSVHCVVTSPPYWGLRDYGAAGQIGLEKTPDEYVARLVAVFGEVWRVLRDDGTLWLNLGDTYASAWACSRRNKIGNGSMENGKRDGRPDRISDGLKEKDLVGIPWRVALALQADGWWLRSEVIWAKKAPMPESVRDRPTRSHEKVFLLTKAARYFYDQDAVREQPADYSRKGGSATYTANGSTTNGVGSSSFHQMSGRGRNQRDVWLLGPEPYPAAHFATFPTEIPRRAILAGTSARGCCPACGAPWKRVIEKGLTVHDGATNSQYEKGSTANRLAKLRQAARERGEEYSNQSRTVDWEPTCGCGPGEPVACTVLDPFLGSGTTLAVAKELGRDGIGIELNPAYVELAWERVNGVQAPLPLAL